MWNASRFIMMNMNGKNVTEAPAETLQPVDRWILSRLNTLIKDVTANMENYELGIAVQKVVDYLWDEFCDWYIEMVKPRLYNTDDAASQNAALWTLKTVLTDALKLLHPYMPFISEEIFCTLRDMAGDSSMEESIVISRWPLYREDRSFPKEEKDIEIIKQAVRAVRNIRNESNVPPSRRTSIDLVSEKEDIIRTFTEGRLFFASLAYANEVRMILKTEEGAKAFTEDGNTVNAELEDITKDAVSVVIPGATLYIPFAELVDVAQEVERLNKEKKRLEGELARVNGMLSNERFLSKAPEDKVAAEREKLLKYTQMMEQVELRLSQLQGE